MKAFILDRYKKGGALRFGDRPEPELGDEDVLVDIHAAGLNPLDSKIRDGAFKPLLPYRPPFILGHDMAGRVVRVGAKVRRFKAGDEVYVRPVDAAIITAAGLYGDRGSGPDRFCALEAPGHFTGFPDPVC
ncbi:NADPH:quinone reductase-like Zn-dependent oxidoreductase [Angulomicrobium tetraedrale]|uniref:NADPH:quinone reductase-like Zn-dependent oxidoreductase n=1 Tax=Ancylobacter tetraedralis TaxID=217068 RepID=A0A839ZG67_9HYPH|nr:NADPH:quinone reductase-like Zn-dependent oxidoreductase [Ancylobacter tetraedralis]